MIHIKKSDISVLLFTILISVLNISHIFAAGVPAGEWRTFYSYNDLSQIVITDNYIYYLTDGGIIEYDKKTESQEIIDKSKGLSGGVVDKMCYCEKTKTLFIIYPDMTINLYKDDECYVDYDIRDKKITAKQVNALTVEGEYVLISTGFGIVKYDTKKREINDTYIIGDNGDYVSVLGTAKVGDSIYAATAADIRVAPYNSQSLVNFETWKKKNIPNVSVSGLIECRDTLLLCSTDGIHVLCGEIWNNMDLSGMKPTSCTQYNGAVTVSNGKKIAYTDGSLLSPVIFEKTNSTSSYDPSTGKVWIGYVGLCDTDTSGVINFHAIEGPAKNVNFAMFNSGDKVVLLNGHNYSDHITLSVLDGETWKTINAASIASVSEDDAWKFSRGLEVSFDSKDDRRMFVGTRHGLYEFYDGEFVTRHCETNSTLLSFDGSPDSSYTLTETAWTDSKGNLFVANVLSNYFIHVKDKEGKWTVLRHSKFINGPAGRKHKHLQNGMDVILSGYNPDKIFFLDMAGTPTDYTDDRTAVVSTFSYSTGVSTDVLIPARIQDIVEDYNGNLWVATDQGPVVLSSVEKVFSGNMASSRPKITRTDETAYADFLLGGIRVNSIVVDGSNRKWLGTESDGLYLVSENGDEIINHFNTTNSPLPTDKIVSLSYQGDNGCLYVLTGNGLLSYGTDSTTPMESFDEISIYPNPVRADFEGNLMICGLKVETNVRITDQRGNVVINSLSKGGAFVWDCKKKDGSKVASGVYNIFLSTQDGTEYAKRKMAIVK